MVSRRSFLTGILMGVTASGIILPTAAEALVLGDRYVRLVSAIRDVHAGKEIYQSIPMTDPIVSRHRVLRDRIWLTHLYLPVYKKHTSELMRILLEDFNDTSMYEIDPHGTVTRLGQALESNLDIFDEDELRRHEDIIVAISVYAKVGGMCPTYGFWRYPFTPQIKAFTKRYGVIITHMHDNWLTSRPKWGNTEYSAV